MAHADMQLRPFDLETRCPACADVLDALGLRVPRHGLRYCLGRACEEVAPGGVVHESYAYEGEPTPHLHWTCARCGYETLMTTRPPELPRRPVGGEVVRIGETIRFGWVDEAPTTFARVSGLHRTAEGVLALTLGR